MMNRDRLVQGARNVKWAFKKKRKASGCGRVNGSEQRQIIDALSF